MKRLISVLVSILLIIAVGVIAVRTVLFPVKYKSDIKIISKEYNIDPYELAALAHFESRFDDKAYEKNSNNGILRFSNKTSTELAKELDMNNFEPKDLVDAKTSLKLGAYYISKFNDEGLSKVVQEWNVRNGEEDRFDRRDYAKQYYLPKIEKNIKILKLLYPDLKN